MSRLIRKQLYLEPAQDALVKEWAAKRGLSEAEVVREALNLYAATAQQLRLPRNPAAWAEEKAFLEAQGCRETVPGRREWEREDLYED
ncbi:MAG: CopG family transcriptional regulator [Bacillota bacterium]|nr:CopG family transcriptional regulator [Bacillota bacterium]